METEPGMGGPWLCHQAPNFPDAEDAQRTCTSRQIEQIADVPEANQGPMLRSVLMGQRQPDGLLGLGCRLGFTCLPAHEDHGKCLLEVSQTASQTPQRRLPCTGRKASSRCFQ